MAKYRNRKTVVDNITFDSKKESLRYSQLKLLLDAGIIRNLLRQPEFPLIVNGVYCGKYLADFSYVAECGSLIIEDVKGASAFHRTPVYRLKKRLVEAMYGVKITEV